MSEHSDASKEKLLSLINELENELQNSDSIDSALMEKVSQDLEQLKARQEKDEEHSSDILLEAAVHFEQDHPKTATIINDIAYLLTNIGV